MRKPPFIWVRVPPEFFRLPDEGYLVCEGVRLKPWRRCHGAALEVIKEHPDAVCRLNDVDRDGGRAIIDLANPRLKLVDGMTGKVRQCREVENELLGL